MIMEIDFKKFEQVLQEESDRLRDLARMSADPETRLNLLSAALSVGTVRLALVKSCTLKK